MLRSHASSLLSRSAASAKLLATHPTWEAAGIFEARASRAFSPALVEGRSWLGGFASRQGISSSASACKEDSGDASASQEATKAPASDDEAAAAAEPAAGADEAPSVQELQGMLEERDAKCIELEAQLADTKDKLVYTLADMENLRQRTARQAEDAKKFAVQGFVKSILDVADNLERATKAVPEEVLGGSGGEDIDAESAKKMLMSMLEGVQLTEKVLLQIFQQNGIEKIEPLGDKFDPNLHQALFEMPDPTKEVGTVGTVTKAGYTLHGRVVRPADVGVVRAQ